MIARWRQSPIWRGLALLAASATCAALVGCSTVADVTGSVTSVGGLLRSAPPGEAVPVQIFVASPRSAQRADGETGVEYALDTISVPPSHEAGLIERPRFGSADPDSDFAVQGHRTLDPTTFQQEIGIHLSGRVGVSRDILVFVHGFNTSAEEARFRLAQIVADSRFTGVPVLFSWKSRGSMFAYTSDKETATASRDDLEKLLADLSATPGLGRIHVLAHSMGSWLAMEALRQNAIAGHPDLGGHLGDIMLAAPDIDLSVFRQQMARLGEQAHVSIFVSSSDRALSLSSRIAGNRPRVGGLDPGNPRDRAELDRLGVKVYDLSAISDGFIGHGVYADAPDVVRSIGSRLAAARSGDAALAAVPTSGGGDRPLDTPALSAPVTSTPLIPPPAAAAH
jgi:esterase/lipase superfamily enzyme